MSLLDFIIMFVIAAITGSVARSLMGFDRGGCILSAIIGFIGAFIGTWIGREFGLPEIWAPTIRNIKYPIVWTTLGAVIFTIILSFFAPGKKKK